jgi:hypothetical protein
MVLAFAGDSTITNLPLPFATDFDDVDVGRLLLTDFDLFVGMLFLCILSAFPHLAVSDCPRGGSKLNYVRDEVPVFNTRCAGQTCQAGTLDQKPPIFY